MRHLIYVLRRADGLVKIGTTTNLAARLRALTTAHGPLEVVRLLNGDRKRELQLHHEFRAHREFGEWFRPPVEALVLSLPDGEATVSTTAEMKAVWEAGERALADEASAKAKDLVLRRQARKSITQAEAVTAISEEHGIPENFLRHLLKGRALTIGAHGYRAIKAAYVSEAKAHIAELEAEMAEMDAEEVAAKRAALNKGAQVR